MKWSYRKLKNGYTRERLKFAWLPIAAEDGNKYWLEFVRVVEVYNERSWTSAPWTVLKAYPAEVEIDRRKPSAPPDLKMPNPVIVPPAPKK